MSDWRDFWQPKIDFILKLVFFGAIVFFAMKYTGAYEQIKQGVMKVLHDIHEAKKEVK